MMLRTHLVIVCFFILFFIPFVEHKFVFVVVALLATYLPDVDSRYSKIGHRKIARILQWFTKHRGMIHSFTFALTLTLILVFVWPVAAFGFFLGYGLHLVADSFTREGIIPFYPLRKKSSGKVRTGGKLEIGLFVGFLVGVLGLLVVRVF